ncbi:MAG: class I SAM-dependent methyltransferase [Pyrinomonadaceae bacterium]
MKMIEYIHSKYTYNRRVRVLTDQLAEITPQNARILDVGCGDGLIAHLIMRKRPDLTTEGLDVLIRDETYIEVHQFDGQKIPYGDNSFDVVRFVDVLHHTMDPMILLREAARVARHSILIKDHLNDGVFADATLRFMDWVGNARHGVVLPYNYWPKQRWLNAFSTLGLSIAVWRENLHLYPLPTNLVFDRSLHFVARIELR